MGQITARINLSAKTFPFLSYNWGRTILVPQYDTNFNRQVQSPEDMDHDIGIPQVYYCHNVMPEAQGFQSIGYDEVITPQGSELTFDYRLNLIDDTGNAALLGICTNKNWYVQEAGGTWLLVSVSTSTEPVFTAYCSGVTYIYQHPGIIKRYNWSTHTIDDVTFTGLDGAFVMGITSSYGYLLAWTKPTAAGSFTGDVNTGDLFINDTSGGPPLSPTSVIGSRISNINLSPGTYITSVTTIAGVTTVGISLPAIGTATGVVFSYDGISGGVFWSSIIDPTDFTPSLITGAGGGAVQEAAGPITLCAPHTKGFFVYTQNNCVVALFTNNSRYPFAFQAIVGSGGVIDKDLVTLDANTSGHYAYTTTGLQLIGLNAAQTVFPEVTDFLSGKVFEDFDDVNKIFTVTRLNNTMKKHIQLVASRYLILSYGINSLTHALVLDIVMQRIGKFKINHVDCFEFSITDPDITEQAKQNIAFLANTGQVNVVAFDDQSTAANGTLILGKYQFVRARLIQLDEINIEQVVSPDFFDITILVSLDGKSISSKPIPTLTSFAAGQAKYNCREIGTNHSLLLQGAFHIESGVLVFHIDGKR